MIPGIRKKLEEKKLRITPQRLAVYEAVTLLKNHPTADMVTGKVRKMHPNISVATVYKILDMLVENGLVRRVRTEDDAMRYDADTASHHHLYCSTTKRIEDFYDEELNDIIAAYFLEKGISGFDIEDIRLQIIGKFSLSEGNFH
jgi:Fur family transcriptional regulator, peroxide stress response regulator